MGQKISFTPPDGQDVTGYLAAPADGKPAPGVVVTQEWWGLNDQIKGVAELEKKLSAAGVRFESHRYQAHHAFASETADSKGLAMLKYDPVCAQLAWDRSLAFFASHLR